ncbi:hypothetical protein ACU21_04950 [Actinobaculum suis]|nr:hypothetical protein ACU20_00965 [Actinobaculum suis]OCA95294.1 hypothetical protein ACU21_04950 [Actinobaculum suis]
MTSAVLLLLRYFCFCGTSACAVLVLLRYFYLCGWRLYSFLRTAIENIFIYQPLMRKRPRLGARPFPHKPKFILVV